MSEELEVLDLPLSSIFKEKKLAKKERQPAFAGIKPETLAQESLGYLPEPSASWRMQVGKDRSSHYRYKHRSGKRSQRTGEKKNIRAKYQNSSAYVLEYIISTINPSPSRLSAGKSLGIKPSPAARVLYCLSFFSADKRSGSGIYCIHTSFAWSWVASQRHIFYFYNRIREKSLFLADRER